MGELQQLYYLPPPPLPPPTAPPPTPPPPLSSHDERSPSASHQEPPPPPRFDPSRMVGIIRRKALIKDLAAVYHAECLTYCQELLELQSKLEEIFEQLRLKEIEGCIGCILHQMGRVKHLEAMEPHVKSKAMIKFWTYEKVGRRTIPMRHEWMVQECSNYATCCDVHPHELNDILLSYLSTSLELQVGTLISRQQQVTRCSCHLLD
ncbi:uncharacterized protein [Coffea arabica]|uniref:Uncharacterized protein isoform X1 n=1 Tax=Coffea arabica TaxID=13443 RepID=A0A6P6UBW9_COFAR|nr:uncharacterized protein LOC113709416 isoform X1 [Coffea arabica]